MLDKVLGIDVGGTGIKGAIVDIKTGEMLTERKKILTPQPPTPEAVLATVNELIDIFEWRGKEIGMGFPCIVHQEVCHSANNISKSWIGINLFKFFGEGTGSKVSVVNDADAAGIAEGAFGAAQGKKGLVLLLTLGTGIGSGALFNGTLIPNIELGSIKWHKEKAEYTVSNKARKTEDLDWKEWGGRLNEYLNHIVDIYSPTEIILGGGVSKKFDKFKEYLSIPRDTPINTAQHLNGAGVIGAAVYHDRFYNQ
jgi:polyphosphate glucokinase